MDIKLLVRKKIRLEGYDYSNAGCYFITICVKDEHEVFGHVVGAISNRPCMELSEIGKIAERTISELNKGIVIDKYVIMPNHVHMFIRIEDNGRTEFAPTISSIIRFYKSRITKQIGYSIWQKSYHDYIIRNEKNYQYIWQYIDENPARWVEDRYYGGGMNGKTI